MHTLDILPSKDDSNPSVGKPDRRSRFCGCLLGGAVGDALGAPIEFLSYAEISSRYGEHGLRDYVAAYGRNGAITDDTQMTLFTAEGLIRAQVCTALRGACNEVLFVRDAYLRWLITQGIRPWDPRVSDPPGLLLGIRELHSRRAPGETCLSALKAATPALEIRARNDSKGCGGVMRVAPVGLLFSKSDHEGREAFSRASRCAALTHGHPTGYLAAGAFAAVVSGLVQGADIVSAVESVLQRLRREAGHEETTVALTQALELIAAGVPTTARIQQLGQGWIAEEALAIGVYCAAASSLEEGIALAVNHGGDSDSTGSIAGNLLGAMHGVDAIPTRWLVDLELADVISRVAHDLHDCREWALGGLDDGGFTSTVLSAYPCTGRGLARLKQ